MVLNAAYKIHFLYSPPRGHVLMPIHYDVNPVNDTFDSI